MTSVSNSSNTWLVCCDNENTLVAVTSILVGFVYMRKLATNMITKKAAVIMAALTPYLPRRPTTNIAIALGEIKIAIKINMDPAKITHNARSDKDLNAKYIELPKTRAVIPVVAAIMLQKFVDRTRDRIMDL